MNPALIIQLVTQFGIPAAREIIKLLQAKSEPTLDDWLLTLNNCETHAKEFLARTANLEPRSTT